MSLFLLSLQYARITLEDLTVAAGELSECTGHVTYCNFTLRPVRARYVAKSEAGQDEAPITYYPHIKRDAGIEYALVSRFVASLRCVVLRVTS